MKLLFGKMARNTRQRMRAHAQTHKVATTAHKRGSYEHTLNAQISSGVGQDRNMKNTNMSRVYQAHFCTSNTVRTLCARMHTHTHTHTHTQAHTHHRTRKQAHQYQDGHVTERPENLFVGENGMPSLLPKTATTPPPPPPAPPAQNPIAENCGKLRENCGARTNPPEASRSNTSACGTHRVPKRMHGGQAKANAENCGKLRKIAQKCAPQSLPHCE